MFLDTIPGHQEIKGYFAKIISEKRVPHAMLFVGEDGMGSLALALGLALALQCEHGNGIEACKKCPSCLKAAQHIHPDIHFAFPVIKKDNLKREDTTSKDFLVEWRQFLATTPYGDINDWLSHLNASDKIANINVAECTGIIKNLGLKTYEGQYKIQIIWCAEYLAKEGNRLLKLIEEPTDNTFIILIASNRNAILNTIRSRCQIISIPPIEDESIAHFLKGRFDMPAEQLSEVVYLASGNIRKSEMLAQQTERSYSDDLLNWLRYGYSGDPEQINEWVDYLANKGKQELKNFVNYGLHFFREYFLGLNLKETSSLRLTSQEKNVILKMNKIIDRSKTIELEKLLGSCITYINRNLSLKILLMDITLKINTILRAEVNKFAT
jgi:DNA polymerase-3 subunit delta'